MAGAAAAQEVATPATANAASEDQSAPADDIIVTGSRIRQNPLEQRAPVIVLD